MSKCKECKFYEPIDENKGKCFGFDVPAEMDVEECPQNSFQTREKKYPPG